MSVYRTGLGFDAHRIDNDGRLRLCGVDIDCDFGLEGHSDADLEVGELLGVQVADLVAGRDMGIVDIAERGLAAAARDVAVNAPALVGVVGEAEPGQEVLWLCTLRMALTRSLPE